MINKIIKYMIELKILIIIMIFNCHLKEITAETIMAGSGIMSDIQIAVNKSHYGDTVEIPEGYFLLKGTVFIKCGIYLHGAGEDKTVLSQDPVFKNEFWIFRIDGRNGKKIRISDITIKGRSPEATPGILLENNPKNIRIDHCKFEKCTKRAIEIHGNANGVIDHNKFINNWYTAIVIYGNGLSAWLKPLQLGNEDAIFVEDNYFEQNNVPDITMAHHIASNNGSKYVFRYNIINDGDMASHAIDAHGLKFGGERGSRSYEIYNNKITATHRWAGINIRGGDGVIFNNTFYGDFVSPIHLMYEGLNGDDSCKYPCKDQIRYLYIWNNVYKGKLVEVYVRQPLIIQNERDFNTIKMPGFVPFKYPHPLISK